MRNTNANPIMFLDHSINARLRYSSDPDLHLCNEFATREDVRRVRHLLPDVRGIGPKALADIDAWLAAGDRATDPCPSDRSVGASSVAELQAAVSGLRADVATLRARLEVLEQRPRRRRTADASALMLTLAELYGATVFSSVDVLKRAAHDAALRAQLEAETLTTAAAIGRRLRSLRGVTVAGLRVRALDRDGGGRLWTIEPV